MAASSFYDRPVSGNATRQSRPTAVIPLMVVEFAIGIASDPRGDVPRN